MFERQAGNERESRWIDASAVCFTRVFLTWCDDVVDE